MKCTYMDSNEFPCDGNLISDDIDARQEWSNESFHCDICGKEFTLRTVYKMQSSIIDTQILYDEEGKEVG